MVVVVVVAEAVEVVEVENMLRNLPNRITFQWHITDICNYRCKHCYQDSYVDNGVSITEQIYFLNKLEEFVKACRNEKQSFQAHINFTGGEPFLRKDFFQLIRKAQEKRLFTFGILSNGYLPSNEELKELKNLKPKFVQISLEGDKVTNDNIRGNGSFDEICFALKTYSKIKIPLIVSFTANSQNYKQLSKVVKIARKYKVDKVWTDRYLPKDATDKLILTTKQTKELFEVILKEKRRSKFYPFSKTQISSHRALQFLVSGGKPYKCSAGNELLAILPNGDIFPCRRLPIKIGNLKSDDLMSIYQTNDKLIEIHNPKNLDKNCLDCYYKENCNGGLKCLSFAKENDYNKKDLNCWI